MREASAAGTPWATRAEPSVWGRVDARPAIISEKKTPIDNTMPLFMNVARMPDAAPRWLAGTLFITAVVFGAANIPDPTPLRKIRRPKVVNEKLAGSHIKRKKVAALRIMPPVANGRAPYRSES